MTGICVVACGQKKQPGEWPALELYVGSYFRQCAAWALAKFDPGDIYVLSAKYGLIRGDEVLTPYNVRLGDRGAITWRQTKEHAEVLGLLDVDEVTVLGGVLYRGHCISVWGLERVKAPFGKISGIGYQMQAMRNDRLGIS